VYYTGMENKKINKTPQKDLAKFTHDLRTPISVIRMSIDVFELSQDEKSKKIEDLIKNINKQVESLLKIIQEFEN
jgi:signal transduction histidine kinase